MIKSIQLEGNVHVLGGIWEKGRIGLSFIKKYPDVSDFFSLPIKLGEEIFRKVEDVVFYELIPSRIYFINNELGFGHREELTLI